MAAQNVFAALLGMIEQRLGLDSAKQFMAFPSFVIQWPVDALLFEKDQIEASTPGDAQRKAYRNHEQFAELVNMILEASATCRFNGRSLWDVYKHILTNAILPFGLEDKAAVLAITTKFEKYLSDLDRAGVDSVDDSSTWYPLDTLPPDDVRNDATWTRLFLDQSQIEDLSGGVSEIGSSWLMTQGLADKPLGSDFVAKSLYMEMFPFQFSRPGFHLEEVFKSREWSWREEPLSDGGTPSKGQCPAFITGVLFARKLTIELTQTPEPRSVNAFVSEPAMSEMTAIKSLYFKNSNQLDVSTIINGLSVNAASGSFLSNAVNFSAPSAASLTPRFPVPVSFGNTDLIMRLTEELNAANLVLTKLWQVYDDLLVQISQVDSELQSQATAERNIQAEIDRLVEEIAKREKEIGGSGWFAARPSAGPSGGSGSRGSSVGGSIGYVPPIFREIEELKRLRGIAENDLRAIWNQEQQLIRDKEKKVWESTNKNGIIQEKTAEVERIAEHLEDLERWSGLSASDDEIYVLCFICERVPKSPNPDLELFPA